MPRYILYEGKKTTKSSGDRKVIGMVESTEMYRKSTCESGDSNENDLNIEQIQEDYSDANFLIFEQNLAIIHFETINPAETYFELSMFKASSYLVKSPCKILISGIIRLHQPSLEVMYGMNKILLEDSIGELCIISGEVIDLYAVVNRIVTIHDRRQIADIFYQNLLVTSSKPERTSSSIINIISDNNRQSKSDVPEYLIYHNDNSRIKTIAMVYGNIRTDDLYQPEQIPSLGLALDTIEFTELQIRVVINKSIRNDRSNLFQFWSIVRVNFINDASGMVCNIKRQAYFRLEKATIVVAGYLGLLSHPNATWANVISGRQDVTISRGRYVAYLYENCMLLLPIDESNVNWTNLIQTQPLTDRS